MNNQNISKARQILLTFLLIIFSLFFDTVAFAQNDLNINNYHAIFLPYYDSHGGLQIAIRQFDMNNTNYFLMVNPYTFATSVAPAINYLSHPLTAYGILENSPYIKALEKYSQPPYTLQNYGVTHAETAVAGMFLTIDLCPAKNKPFETGFFNELVTLANNTQHSIPIAISITGNWLLKHPQEFNWLVQQENANKLNITWINHTYYHHYYPNAPLQNNFLLAPNTNFTNEVFALEKLLLQNHQVPSVFFRFPGLVSDQALILKLHSFGLIAVGSDAWLAKGQIAKNGSIILVHGNSNEPLGIQLIMPILADPHLHLLPLRDVFPAN